jgi:hypothetical protein
MATATERVSVLMTPAEKKLIITKAKKTGVSVGEFLRRAAEGYRGNDDDKVLAAMIDQMNQATEKAELAIDDVLQFVAESNQRIAELEAKARGEAA